MKFSLIISFTILLYSKTWAFEENNKFCIHTEPLLLTDIEKHVNPIAGDPDCEVFATTLTVKEKESLFNTLCKDHGSLTIQNANYQYFKLRNGELHGRDSYKIICSGQTHPLLAWVPYRMIQQNYAQELDPKERSNYIAKATDIKLGKTELCHFRHNDLVTNITDSLFTCIMMIFEDNFFDLSANINVLVQILPITYEVRNVTYVPWMNVTTSYKTLLGQTVLKNPSREQKQIFGSINYSYVEKIKLNTTTIYGEKLEKLPLVFEHKNAAIELDNNGNGSVYLKDKSYFGGVLEPKSSANVYVTGQWAEHSQQFSAEIYEYFGYNIKRYHSQLHNGKVSFTRIDSTEPVFDLPIEKSVQNNSIEVEKSARLTVENGKAGVGVISTKETDEEWEIHYPTGGHPYPGLYPWFVVSALIVGGVFLIVLIMVLRSCGESEEQSYKLTNSTP